MNNDSILEYKRDDVVFVGIVINDELLIDDKIIALANPNCKIGNVYHVKLDIKYAGELISFYSSLSSDIGTMCHRFTSMMSDWVFISKNKETVVDAYRSYLCNKQNDIDYLRLRLERRNLL